MKYLMYVYAADAAVAEMAARQLGRVDKAPTIRFVNDPTAPVEGAALERLQALGEVVPGSACRHGNLNGLEFLFEHLERLGSMGEEETVCKLDADCWMRTDDFLRTVLLGTDIAWLEKKETFTPTGVAYLIRPRAARQLLEYLTARNTHGGFSRIAYPEDMTIFHAAAMAGLKQECIPWQEGMCAGFDDSAEGYTAAVLHMGEPVHRGGQDVRVSREHVLCRMRLMECTMYNGVCGGVELLTAPRPRGCGDAAPIFATQSPKKGALLS